MFRMTYKHHMAFSWSPTIKTKELYSLVHRRTHRVDYFVNVTGFDNTGFTYDVIYLHEYIGFWWGDYDARLSTELEKVLYE